MAGLFKKKDIEKCLHCDTNNGLKRTLSPVELILLGIGAIIGAGIFIVVGEASVISGPSIILSFIIAGIACGFTALCYAEMASIITITGGIYTYTQVTMGEISAWTIGWISTLQYIIAASTVAIGWSAYVTGLLKSAHLALPSILTNSPFMGAGLINLPACLIVLLLTGILVKGTKESAKFNTAIVLIKIAVIVLFIIVGFNYINPMNYYPFTPNGLLGMFDGAAMVFFAYMGFDTIAAAAEETKNPQKALPIGITGSLVICSILYILVSIVMIGMVHYSMFSGSAAPIQLALQSVGATWIMTIVTIGAIAGLTTVILVTMFVVPRILLAMSRDKLLPKKLTHVHPKYKSPINSILIVGATAALIAGLAPASIFEIANIAALTTFIFLAITVILLRKQRPDIPRKFKCPSVPLIPILSIITSLILIIRIKPVFIEVFIIWILIGLAFYLIYQKKRVSLKIFST